jgi:hypothetical protein
VKKKPLSTWTLSTESPSLSHGLWPSPTVAHSKPVPWRHGKEKSRTSRPVKKLS